MMRYRPAKRPWPVYGRYVLDGYVDDGYLEAIN